MKALKIALADDHKLFRKGLKELIESASEHKIIIEAENGNSLLSQLKKNQPDLVLMDLKMPDMDGIEATKQIKEKYPDIAILALSMFDDDKFILHLLELGASGYLLKDTDPMELLEALKSVAEKGYYYSEKVTTVIAQNISKKNRKKPAISPVEHLTHRELEVLKLICEGSTTSEIAKKLFISARTVEGHRKKLLEKTKTKNVAALVAFAFKNDLL
ncbi:MAG: response regulator transcription factor [Bacteroidetes bacterium]|nr:response regulator transcription factor [Bacteroidota bacterium]